MTLIKKFGKKIKNSVPEEYQKPEEKETVELEPWKDVLDTEKEPEYKTVKYEKARHAAESITENAEKKPSAEPITKTQSEYIDSMIKRCEQTIIQSENQLNYLRTTLDETQRKVKILKAIKNNNMSFEIGWLLNRINKLRDSSNGWKRLENEIYGYIEEIVDNGKK